MTVEARPRHFRHVLDRAKKEGARIAGELHVNPTDKLVIASDLEGPHVIGDTAVEGLNFIFQGTVKGMSRGALMHRTIDTIVAPAVQHRKTQVGASVIMSAPFFWANGIADEDLTELALESLTAPGSDEWRKTIRESDGKLIAVTTAWEHHHKPLAEGIGMDGIVGTKMVVEEIRNRMSEDPLAEEQRAGVLNFMDDCASIMDAMDHGELAGDALKRRLSKFYRGELGLWRNLPSQPTLGKIIEDVLVIGNIGKLGVAQGYFNNAQRVSRFAIGDGSNDWNFLRDSKALTVGVNGGIAAEAADLGLVTPDLGVLSELMIMYSDPHTERFPHEKIIQRANRSDRFQQAGAELHFGGRIYPNTMSEDLHRRHAAMRSAIRGESGSAVI